MAAISTEIKLQDKMSGALNRITANLYKTVSAFQGVDKASDKAFDSPAISAAAQELYAYNQRVTQLEADLVDANNRIQQMQEKTEKAAKSADVLKTAFRAVKGVVAAIGFGKIIETSDGLVQTTSRLSLMTNSAEETQELFESIYASAQNARGSLSGMADVVARFGNNARAAFDSNEEVVAFANIVQKQMTIAGASTAEAQNAILQLSQGLGSGVLRGDELNSIFEQAPNLIQSIADYMGKPIGEIRTLASEGQITADIVKAAVFASADDVNAKFKEMPMTWAQIWQSMQNTALMKFQPVLDKINDIANSEDFQTMFNKFTSAFAMVADTALKVFDTVGRTVKGFRNVLAENFGNFDLLSTLGTVLNVLAIAFSAIGDTAVWAFGIIVDAATTLYDNLSWIAPIVLGIAGAFAVYKAFALASAAATAIATGAQKIYNAVMAANPTMIVIMAIVAIIGLLVALAAYIAKTTDVADSALGVIAGAVMWLVSLVKNLFLGMVETLLGYINYLVNPFINFANFLGNVFQNPISSIIYLFQGMADVALGVLETIASAMDLVLGTSMADTVAGWRDTVKTMADELVAEYAPEENYEQIFNKLDLGVDDLGWERTNNKEAFAKGAAWGDGVSEKLSSAFSLDGLNMDNLLSEYGAGGDYGTSLDEVIAKSLGNIDTNTAATANKVDISNENLEYLRDSAEKEAINKFTTAEIKLDMTNNNNIASSMDIDGIVTQLSEGLREAMESAAEGVYA